MHYNYIGTSSLLASHIGFGCMSLKPAQKENIPLLHQALDMGINLFDTADLYDHGENEVLLGKAFKNKRDKIILATKVGNKWRKDGSGWDWCPDKKYILSAIDKSLQRLKTDYIDLYQLHGGTIEDPMDEMVEAFEELVSKGKIKYYGISSIRPNVIRNYLSKSNIVATMMQYSLLDRRPEEECFILLKDKKVGVLARGVLAKGLLVDKKAAPFLEKSKEEVAFLLEKLKELQINEIDAGPALGFVLNNPAISSALIGFRTKEQLQNVLEAWSQLPLEIKHINTLQSIFPTNIYDVHR